MRGRFFLRGIEEGALKLRKVERILELYLTGLSGKRIPIVEGKEAYTNTREIYLPSRVKEFPEEDENLRFYKFAALHKYAQVIHGSFSAIKEALRPFINKKLAMDIFSLVENARLEHLLQREYRGVKEELRKIKLALWRKREGFHGMDDREMALEGLVQLTLAGRTRDGLPRHVRAVVEDCYARLSEVQEPGASAGKSWEVTRYIYYSLMRLDGGYRRRARVSYFGEIKPKEIHKAVKELRRGHKEGESGVTREERGLLRSRLFNFATKGFLGSMDINVGVGRIFKGRIDKISKQADYHPMDGSQGEPLPHDSGRVGMDYKAPGSDGFIFLKRKERPRFLYHEWDYRRRRYHREWCTVREANIRIRDKEVVKRILVKHSVLLKKIKKQFEALRREARRLRRQYDGDEIDLDATVNYFIDMQAGESPDEKLYSRLVRRRRDVAVGFLIDHSNSTAGATLEVEKEALVLMSHALRALGDSFAIYGFSSNTRWECNFSLVKDFHEVDGVERIAGINPGGYTRMGAAIRHATRKLQIHGARNKILMLLTDGSPLDYDGYDGRYALEDTRMAIVEARNRGVHPFCITVDIEARDYLPKMFGNKMYTIIDRVSKLPKRLPLIYARLTS
jgi:nitric oxide reductase NorD protein